MHKSYFSVKLSAAATGLSRSTLYREMAEGNLVSKKVRGRRLIDWDSLMALGEERMK